jgi:hypothetical protein
MFLNQKKNNKVLSLLLTYLISIPVWNSSSEGISKKKKKENINNISKLKKNKKNFSFHPSIY